MNLVVRTRPLPIKPLSVTQTHQAWSLPFERLQHARSAFATVIRVGGSEAVVLVCVCVGGAGLAVLLPGLVLMYYAAVVWIELAFAAVAVVQWAFRQLLRLQHTSLTRVPPRIKVKAG